MTVIIVHGTHDRDGDWWIETTPGSFASAIDQALVAEGSEAAVWRVAGLHTSSWSELLPEVKFSWLTGRKAPPFENREGRFRWSGADLHGVGRQTAGRELARYLQTIAKIAPQERLTVIAHSHGCNVVKQATQDLPADVNLDRIVLLACPHFVGIQDGSLPYAFNTNVLRNLRSPVVNLYSPQDTVQTTIAETLADLGLPPGMPKLDWFDFAGTPLVDAHRTDQDPAVADCYEELSIPYDGGKGIAAHGAVHSTSVGTVLGHWLAQSDGTSATSMWEQFGTGSLAAS